MCYNIEINLTREQLEKRFNAKLNKDLPYRKQNRVSAFTLPACPIVCCETPEEIKLLNWGLIPFWVRNKDAANSIRMKTFNARSETLTEKPSFRHLIKSKKCIVLTNGFYEWQTRGKVKQPFFIGVRDEEATALAGLHDQWANKETGELLNTFTIITTQANPLMEVIHNTKKRMPVILHEKDEQAWIDESLSTEKSLAFLKPFDERRMFAEEVDKQLFSKVKRDDDMPRLF